MEWSWFFLEWSAPKQALNEREHATTKNCLLANGSTFLVLRFCQIAFSASPPGVCLAVSFRWRILTDGYMVTQGLDRFGPPNKMVNTTSFYCDTLNFVAIRRFSATTVVFRCLRVTCCHQNFSVAIKIVIVATR